VEGPAAYGGGGIVALHDTLRDIGSLLNDEDGGGIMATGLSARVEPPRE
jgi:hypothetical protein